MTAKMILDAFSETLMKDERILSARERELLSNLLQNSKVVSGNRPEIQSAVADAVARSVGETVAQRAFTVLGGSIVDRILAGSSTRFQTEESISTPAVMFGVPQPPSGVPQPPSGPKPGEVPQPPSGPRPDTVPQPPSGPRPDTVPQPPSGPRPDTVPQPPSGPRGRTVSIPVQQAAQRSQDTSVGVLEPPVAVRAQSVVLDEFLAPHELDELMAYALEHETEFHNSEVISPSGEPGVIDYKHRRSRVLMDLGKHQDVILERIQSVLPRVLDQLGIEAFPITHVEAQMTASNDGDFFGAHSDDAQQQIAARRITFVYFFQREPRPFTGGELRLYDPGDGAGQYFSADKDSLATYQTIVPRQNQIVFFPCSLMHEITPVQCSSRAFADSRFTLNGWLHK